MQVGEARSGPPAGSGHPRFGEWVYPVAYGYLDGTDTNAKTQTVRNGRQSAQVTLRVTAGLAPAPLVLVAVTVVR